MKKGDEYLGKDSGLRLKIKDIKAKAVIVEAERRTIDRKTAEIKIETREREVPNNLVEVMLLGYEKA